MTDMKQTVHLRENALAEVGGILDDCAAERVLFVVDEAAYQASGADEVLEPSLASRHVERFTGFELNPKLHDVERGVRQCRALQPNVVLALGGGTALDLAKLIGTLAAQDDNARDVITGQGTIQSRGPALIAVPTTAGTGSEATHFAVAYVESVKYSVAHPSLLPAYAIVDPRLTGSLPPGITVATGLDAFCQAIESIWAVGATDESIAWATSAAELAFVHLPQAVNSPTMESRLGMCLAAHQSGQAINISKTTAPHALSYAITTQYAVPHGIAVAMTLAPMLAYNSGVTADDCTDPRGPQHVRDRIAMIVNLLQADSVSDTCQKIRDLIAATGSPGSLADIGVTNDDAIADLASQVNTTRLSNNPRQTTPEALTQVLKGQFTEAL